MTVHQCPHCELTFSYKTEVEWHVREEHGLLRQSTSGEASVSARQ